MKVVIIEDEKLAANHLEKMILKYDKDIKILAKLESVGDAVDWFNNNTHPDLLFLDIHLEDDLSFAIFEKVKVNSPIIFTTAFDEYAIRAFKMKSIDYLLKPIIQEELNMSLEKYKEWTKPAYSTIDLNSLYELISKKEPQYVDRFSVMVGQKLRTIAVEDVGFFYSEESITFLVTNDKSKYSVDYSLDQLGDQLNPNDFFRINRQFLVNLKSIKNVIVFPKSRLKVELNPPSDKEVFVSIDKVTRFKAWLGA
jgi:DNA-binding LytR/AlgR family response regulator